jgi:1-deoxy-D-xylulose-5-phosphate reductoisomerase
MLAHETNMDIPIFNSIYDFPSKNFYKTKDLNIDKINKLSLSKPNIRKFKTLNLLKLIPSKDSLFETVVITVNDELVNMFLSGKIDFRKLLFYLIKIINFKLFKKYCNIRPKSIKQIYKVRNVTKEFVNDYIKTK